MTYDYKCPKCGRVREARVAVAERDELFVLCMDCNLGMERQFTPNAQVMIPERFGLSRTWHLSDQGSSREGMVGNNSQVHAPKRETFQQSFDQNWSKFGRA